MNQYAMLEMLKDRVQQMEGGKRRVGRPRKRRVRGGEIDGYEMSASSAMEGMGLVGGKRRVGRPRKGVIPPQFRAHIAALRRKKSGRGLVGGNQAAQDLYEEYATQNKKMPPEVVEFLKLGIKPLTKKELLIKTIMKLEKQIGFRSTPEAHLKKYTIKALEALAAFYRKDGKLLAYPPVKGLRDEYDDEGRFADPNYIVGDDGALEPTFGAVEEQWLTK